MTSARDSAPTISVIVPTYNRAHLLGRAIGSVLRQTFKDFDLIVVDDGSTDNTEQVVGSFCDPRIRYLRMEENRGAAAARNHGIRSSRAPYVAFMDSDDEWLPVKLEKQLQVFQTSEFDSLGVVICGCQVILEKGERIAIPNRRGWVHEDLLAMRHNLSNINMLIKKSTAESQLWFDDTLRSSEEWDLQIRLSTICQFDIVPEPLVCKYENETDRIYWGENIPKGHAEVIKRHMDEFQAVPSILARHWAGIGLSFLRLGQRDLARHAIREAIKVRPWLIRPHVYRALTFMPGRLLAGMPSLRVRHLSLRDSVRR